MAPGAGTTAPWVHGRRPVQAGMAGVSTAAGSPRGGGTTAPREGGAAAPRVEGGARTRGRRLLCTGRRPVQAGKGGRRPDGGGGAPVFGTRGEGGRKSLEAGNNGGERGVAVGLEKKSGGRNKGLEFCTIHAHHRRFITRTGGDASYHRRSVLQTGGDAFASHHQRFVTRTGGDRQHHRRFPRPLRPTALEPAVIPHHRRFMLNRR